MGLDMGIYGLAWAQSIVAAVEVVILFIVMGRRTPGLFDVVFVHAVGRMTSATGFMALITYLTVRTFPLTSGDQSFLATFPKFALIVSISLGSYVILSKLLGLEEVDPILRRAKALLFNQTR
jgi:hypothetical protein